MPRQSIGDKLDAIFDRLETIEETQFDIIEFLLEMKHETINKEANEKTKSQARLQAIALTKKKRSDKIDK